MTEELLYPYENLAVTQIITPGRGIETGVDNPYAGFILEDSPHSQASYERAVATAEYTKLHRNIGRVVFSGEVSFMVPEADRPLLTEAEAMDAVAHAIDPDMQSVRERKSRTSIGNMVNSVREGYLDPNQVTGVVIHEDHAKRFLKAARLVMPNTTFEVIPADRPGNTEMRKPSRNDRIADLLYSVAMLGVTPGDIDTIARRDEMVQRNVLRVVNGLRKVLSPVLGNRDLKQDQYAEAA